LPRGCIALAPRRARTPTKDHPVADRPPDPGPQLSFDLGAADLPVAAVPAVVEQDIADDGLAVDCPYWAQMGEVLDRASAAEQAGDHEAARRALREHDSLLRLSGEHAKRQRGLRYEAATPARRRRFLVDEMAANVREMREMPVDELERAEILQSFREANRRIDAEIRRSCVGRPGPRLQWVVGMSCAATRSGHRTPSSGRPRRSGHRRRPRSATARSSAASGDSGDDGPGEPPPPDGHASGRPPTTVVAA